MSIQLFLITPIALMVILEAHTLLAVWIDGSFSESAGPIVLFVTLSYFFRSLNNLPTYCAMSLNAPRIISKYEFFRLLFITALIYPMVKTYGLQGAAATLFLTSLLNLAMIYEISKVLFNVNIFQRLTRPFIAHGIISALLYSLYNYWYLQSAWYTPYGVLACGIIYWFLAWFHAAVLGSLTPEDSRRLVRLFTRWK
jgi:O-antigen/teichoic acid export membrane protein